MSSTTVPAAAPAMADDEKEKSTNQILQALDALSHTLYQARANIRATSLALPRSAAATDGNDAADADGADAPRPRSRRLSLMAPFRSRSSKLDKNENGDDDDDDDDDDDTVAPLKNTPGFAGVAAAEAAADGETTRKGRIWSWAPIRALSHIGMRRMGCLFSVEVVAAQGLPPSMNALRLAVAVRKKEARDGAVQTMPARAQQGAADFDETLFIRCHLYGTGGGGGKPLRFEPRPFLLSLLAVEAPELDFGRSAVDLSLFAKEFTDKCQQGECVRQWDMVFPLAGKAKGGELVVKLAFQSIDDGGGAGMYSQPEPAAAETEKSSSSSASGLSSLARKIRKSSFSMMLTPRVTRTDPLLATAKVGVPAPDMRGIDNFKLDDDVATPVAEVFKEEKQKETPESKTEEQQKEAPEPETEVEHKEAQEPLTEEQQKEVPEPVTEEQLQKEVPELVMEEQQKVAPEKEAVEEQQKEPEPEPETAEDAQADDDDDAEIPEFEVVDKGVEAQIEKDELNEEAAGDEAVNEALEPTTMLCDVAAAAADESVEPPPQDGGSPLDDANENEVATGDSLPQVPEQGGEGGKDDAAGKSPPAGFGWRTIAIVVAPVAVLVSKTLAGR